MKTLLKHIEKLLLEISVLKENLSNRSKEELEQIMSRLNRQGFSQYGLVTQFKAYLNNLDESEDEIRSRELIYHLNQLFEQLNLKSQLQTIDQERLYTRYNIDPKKLTGTLLSDDFTFFLTQREIQEKDVHQLQVEIETTVDLILVTLSSLPEFGFFMEDVSQTIIKSIHRYFDTPNRKPPSEESLSLDLFDYDPFDEKPKFKKATSFGFKSANHTDYQQRKKILEDILNTLQKNLSKQLINIEKTSMSTFIDILLSNDLFKETEEIHFSCETKQLRYILNHLKLYFFHQLEFTTVESSQLFFSRSGKALKAGNLYASSSESVKQSDEIDRVFSQI
ncbi:MAG: DUF6617 family protein [Bacteroidota bacterium]